MTTPNANGVNLPTNGLHFAGLLHSAEENNMNYSTEEHFLPNATSARLEDPEDNFDHGIDCFEFPSDTALRGAQSRVRQLESNPLTAYVLTNDFHDFLLAMQHWIGKGFYVGDSSAIVCRPDLQSAKLFRPLD